MTTTERESQREERRAEAARIAAAGLRTPWTTEPHAFVSDGYNGCAICCRGASAREHRKTSQVTQTPTSA